MVNKKQILAHTEVVCATGNHIGIVDHLEGDDMIKLTKNDPESGGKHHLIPLAWVKEVKENQVILNKPKNEVVKEWKAA